MEAQQHRLEAAVHTMYYRLLAANAWPGPRLVERNGNPLIHDVLAVLGLLETDGEDRPDREQNELENIQQGSQSGDGSIVESPEERHQERRNSAPAPTQNQGAYHSRNQSEQSLQLVPEEARWFGGIPELLTRTATGTRSLTAPRRLDYVASSSSKPQLSTANHQQQTQSLPASLIPQQTLRAAGGSKAAAQNPLSFEAIDWNLAEDSSAWWYEDQVETEGQRVPLTMENSGDLNGPCELDGLWQSTQHNSVPQALPPDDEQMDRELPTHFLKIGW
ncbi:hypothetical protein QM012_003798 [Aureobasidium pullulans]|uniref:Uncharacterized protein n=1 Tax=Aureobasidium pullulans TaxID=5580 RepID=A0ABR0T8B0_AURPU